MLHKQHIMTMWTNYLRQIDSSTSIELKNTHYNSKARTKSKMKIYSNH